MSRHSKRTLPASMGALFLALSLMGCDNKKRDLPLSGQPTDIVQRPLIARDKQAASVSKWPSRTASPSPFWIHPLGGRWTHETPHIPLWEHPHILWQAPCGRVKVNHTLSGPVALGDTLFFLDAQSTVHAYHTVSGQPLWKCSLSSSRSLSLYGGGIACEGQILYITTPCGELVAMKPNGKILWRRLLGAPCRGAPVVAGGRVWVQTISDHLQAFSPQGELVWKYSSSEPQALLQFLVPAAPAVSGTILIAGLASGEVVALDTQRLKPLWSVELGTHIPLEHGIMGQITQAGVAPVVIESSVIVTVPGQRTTCLDVDTGSMIWDVPGGSFQLPLVVGNHVLTLEVGGVLVSRRLDTGALQWKTLVSHKIGEVPVGPLAIGPHVGVIEQGKKLSLFDPLTGQRVRTVPLGFTIAPVLPGVWNNQWLFIGQKGLKMWGETR